MAFTPVSSLVSYISPDEFLSRFDSNLVGELVSDQNLQVNSTDLSTNPVLLTILADVSGMLESAACVGKRYGSEDLTAMATSGTVSGQYLKRVCANLAIGMLRQRRGMIESDEKGGPYIQALEALDKLRNGERIFTFAETEEAGLPSNVTLSPEEIERLNLFTNNFRYFGFRQRSWARTTW